MVYSNTFYVLEISLIFQYNGNMNISFTCKEKFSICAVPDYFSCEKMICYHATLFRTDR